MSTTAPIFPNYAGRSGEELDADLIAELNEAGIPHETLPECMRKHQGEVESIIIGSTFRWSFTRAWYYWVAKGPGLPLDVAQPLHDVHGRRCRVDGNCGCPSPIETFHGLGVGSYHVDTQEALNALASAIREVVERTEAQTENLA